MHCLLLYKDKLLTKLYLPLHLKRGLIIEYGQGVIEQKPTSLSIRNFHVRHSIDAWETF